ncbi:related to carboxylic acid transport protein JEN1 [Melanopsichium pennsylvanicum]|uniref:Related to carboxylic acid transport protein JEN1 n=2 Tax=Melanopsichium pennsylvanicum TaxID=63383 RepID=A0AAJ5C5R3_9BASI|nr:related to carboxylic acid transport protein JEN1 [Melanopsichium pennsylvanicum 4]SNX84794.1 related to carboxylic acid transport protein JEN1 [Melanopsichium pennsylvanicum]
MVDPTHGLFKLPSKEERAAARNGASVNPIKLAMMLTPMQAAMFFSGWLAWTVDAWDFFAVSLSVSALERQFDKPAKDITTAITLTLLFRSVGAAIFGVISDRYGRKYPLVINLIIIAALSLGSGFLQTYQQFLAVRSLFGIGMGGIWGMATATALENMPAAPRGLFSGILQQGYAVGYLLAASVNLTWVDRTHNWRILFFLGAGISALAAAVRLTLPESELFLRQKAERDANGNVNHSKAKVFMTEIKQMLKTHWLRCIYGILLMTGFNFLSHSSQDLYPTMLQKSKLLTARQASKATIISNCGAISGGFIAGYLSQYLGRRLTIIMFIIITGALIPAWILPHSFSGLAAGAFFLQFGVQGAWGVVPIYLSEIAPPALRATYCGLAYQLGNAASSASSQIEATGGDNLKDRNPRWHPGSPSTVDEFIPAYARVSAILLGTVCAYLIIVVTFGWEFRGAEFDEDLPATISGAGEQDPEQLNKQSNTNHTKVYGEDSIEHIGDHRGASPMEADDEKKM